MQSYRVHQALAEGHGYRAIADLLAVQGVSPQEFGGVLYAWLSTVRRAEDRRQ